ncbi:hypothetical protein SAMN04488698_1385 [Candidatus Frackibacter sp. WG12]|nr:hypothetical protein SAMN04515661_1366 [Candidatus Frackibacter sp. WG11]SEN02162.1 hypothetical protein SAMN04488698_1385 [Candidatus Frackibacter sp. WG12]SFM10896.1 hypothetical protein SAMN04488699_1394 [Candidatus Frackibacter sp. WG13]
MMKSLREEEKMASLNKKEKVVYWAKSDPFLKVEELAEKVETTPHYVRTVLSEAKLSLTKLRKKYARKMEKLSNLSSNQFLIDIINILDLEVLSTEKLDRVILNDYQSYQQLVKDNNFQERTSIIYDQNEPILINTTLLLPKEDKVDSKHELDNLLNAKSSNINFTNPILEIEEANYDLAESLQIQLGASIFKVSCKIIVKGEVQGLDIVYLRNDNCQISLSGKDTSFQIKKAN